VLFDGAGLHHAALYEMSRGRWDAAERLFERAARRYRVEVRVEPLARLRAHQLIARIRGGRTAAAGRELAIVEAERLLCRLTRIESLNAPFALTDAHALIGAWLGPDDTERAAA
jgi:hypothetical protein